MPINRYIYAGLYLDRDGTKKDIFYTFRKRLNSRHHHHHRTNGKRYIHFRGSNGMPFKYWNTGRSKIDMITWTPHLKDQWKNLLAPDGSWIPGRKMRGVKRRHQVLLETFDDQTFVDPWVGRGRDVFELDPMVNTMHTKAGAIPGGDGDGGGVVGGGDAWVDPDPDLGFGNVEEGDEDGMFFSEESDDGDDDDDDGDLPGLFVEENGELRELQGRLQERHQDAVMIDDSDDGSDKDGESLAPVRSRKEKGKERARPFGAFFDLSSPSISPERKDGSEIPKIRTLKSLKNGETIDLSQDEDLNHPIIKDRTAIDLTGEDYNEQNANIPMPSIEMDISDDDDIKIESRRSTPYRVRLEAGSLRTCSQSAASRIYSHSPLSVGVPSSWPRRKSRKRELSSSSTFRVKSPTSPTPSTSSIASLRTRMKARERKVKEVTKSWKTLSTKMKKEDEDEVRILKGSKSPKKEHSPVVVLDQEEIIIIDD